MHGAIRGATLFKLVKEKNKSHRDDDGLVSTSLTQQVRSVSNTDDTLRPGNGGVSVMAYWQTAFFRS